MNSRAACLSLKYVFGRKPINTGTYSSLRCACTRDKSVQLTLCTKDAATHSEFDHYPPAIVDVRHRNHTTLNIQRLYC